jgi:hypothetical protein
MPIATPQALSKDSPTDVDTNTVSYAQRFSDESKSVFSVAGLTPPVEKKLTISHETGKAGEHRHLIRLDRTEVDALGVPGTLSTYVVIVRPPNTALTDAICIEEVNRLIDFLIEGGANANVTAVLNFET